MNFEEKHKYLVHVQSRLSQGAMFAIYNGWLHKNMQEHQNSKKDNLCNRAYFDFDTRY